MKDQSKKIINDDSSDKASESDEEIDKINLINKLKEENFRLMKDNSLTKEERLKYLLKQTDIYAHFLMSHQLASEKRGKDSVSKHRSGSITKDFDDNGYATTRLYKQPGSLVGGDLKSYQLDGLNWMISLYESKLNGILADEMGLGKTIQTISLLSFLKEYKKKNGFFLVIVPKSTVPNWNREIQKWNPNLKLIVLNPVKEEREETLKQIAKQKFEVLVTSYEGINICMNVLKKITWEALIIDEAHRIKNEHALLSKNVRLLKAKFRLLVTGTPLQNNLHELWALLNFLLPDLFSSSEDFDLWFGGEQNNQEDSIEKQEEKNVELVHKLHKILKPFLLRRTKTEVETTLPPKKEIHIKVGLTEMQKDIYKKLLKKSMDSESKIAYKNIIMQLRKCCNHPYLFEGVEDMSLPDLGEHLIKNSSKMRILDKLVDKLMNQKGQCLIFSQMTRVLDILEDFLCYKNLKYCRIDGNTSLDDRESQIADFTKPGSDIFCFLLSTRAGGLGINLMSANTVVLFDSDWNPQVDLQAMDRIHRIGQTKPCLIYRLICENTIEEKIIERQAMRLKLDSLVIQQGRVAKGNENFSKEQMKDMIQYGADVIFKAGDDCKDEDIELILEKGEKFTNDFYDKAEKAAKSKVDLLLSFNFNNKDNNDMYIFEDEDYLKKRQEYGDAILASKEYDEMKLQSSKRDRNLKLSNLNFDQNLDMLLKQEKIIKKKYKQIKLPYYHLYQNRERLIEIKQKQANNFVDNNKKIPDNFEYDFSNFEDLSKQEAAEMIQYGSTGFINWDKREYDVFINYLEKNGAQGSSLDELVELIETKTKDEISEYLKAFWTRAKDLPDGSRLLKNIEKKNKASQQKELSQKLISLKIKKSKAESWETVNIIYPINANRHAEYSHEEDNFLIWLSYTHGYGNWDSILKEIRLSDDFMFNYFLKSRSASDLSKRMEYLIKVLQREFSEEPEIVSLLKNFHDTMNLFVDGLKTNKMDIDQESNDIIENQDIKQSLKKSARKKPQSNKMDIDE